MRFVGSFALRQCDKTLPGRYRVRPSRKRESFATPFRSSTQKLHDLHVRVGDIPEAMWRCDAANNLDERGYKDARYVWD